MQSTPQPTTGRVDPRDLTTRARIRDAAIARFAEHGAARTSIKAIANDAGVSPALVFHYFGTKEGLRDACDQYVLASVRESKQRSLKQGPHFDFLGALEGTAVEPILGYLARMLAEGSEHAVTLVDGMVDVAVAAYEEGVRSGVLRPVSQTRDLNTVLVLWSLGLLVLRDHAERLLGVDVTGSAQGRVRYWRLAFDAISGLLTDEAYEHGMRALDELDRATKEET